MAHEVAAETVADRLRAEATRSPTLDAIEALAPPVSRDVALGAAPGLVDVAASTGVREELDRSALLLARLLAEAAPDSAAVWGAAFAGARLEAYMAPRLLSDATQRALVHDNAGRAEVEEGLTRQDAHSYACRAAIFCCGLNRGFTVAEAAAGRTVKEYIGIVRAFTSAPPRHATMCASANRH